MIPNSDRWPSETLKPANSIVGSDPGTPITPDVKVSSATPASPRSRMMCVARVTSESVTDARASSTAGKRSGRPLIGSEPRN